eukprot:gene896-195_t
MASKLKLIFLLFCLKTAFSEVVDNFDGCNDFFYKRMPPGYTENQIMFGEKLICQRYKDSNDVEEVYYATLYSTKNRIPIYSAYKLPLNCDGSDTSLVRKKNWFIEPQV